ncbi:hypothetical protein [Kitasatospora griseola]|uniref:hypothetical protein n=1 Tax=Kitasatospora griseola TaxID=2064 RepID=UPI001671666D|nr:hypothetical protein [Kitasatospora griseola]GGR04446.1 hypothetical protein GCM10010195_69920 [Kitasatospora griseola]
MTTTRTKAARIRRVHADGTTCDHQVHPRTGQPKDPSSGCTGRTGYSAHCPGCGQTITHDLRVVVSEALKYRHHHNA